MGKKSICVGALSDVGSVKKSNQDSILVKIGEEAAGEFGIFVVADGMGGLAAGGTASEIAVSEIKHWWEGRLGAILSHAAGYDINNIGKELDSLIYTIHEKVANYGRLIGDKVGTTLSLLFILRDQFIIKHVGDSRIYIINREIQQATLDHSWVEQQVREGKMSRVEAKVHPRRNVLTQCIGASDVLEIYTYNGIVFPQDIFLLCSDGFYNHINDEEIFDASVKYRKSFIENRNTYDIQSVVANFFELVECRGATDNVSAILAFIYEPHKKGFLSKIKGFMLNENT